MRRVVARGIHSFITMTIQPSGGHGRPDPAEFFKRADTDNSGGISKDELKAALQKSSKTPDGQAPDVDQLFAAADQDGDGQISEAENTEAMQAMRGHHHGHRAASSDGFVGSSDALNAILETLRKQDNGENASLTDEQRKAVEQFLTDLKSTGLYTAQGKNDCSGSASLFGSSA